MIERKNDANRNLEKALQALEQAKQRAANEKKGFRTRADSIADNKAGLSGERNKFNGNLIESWV